jgi:hypothetical protein
MTDEMTDELSLMLTKLLFALIESSFVRITTEEETTEEEVIVEETIEGTHSGGFNTFV